MGKILKIINEFISDKYNLDKITNLSIKKSYLLNPYLQSNPYIKALTKILFPEESSEKDNPKENKENLFYHKIITSLIKQIFIYNEAAKIIKINKNFFDILKKGQIPEYIKHNIDYGSILEQFDPFPFFGNITKFINFKLNLTIKEKIKPTMVNGFQLQEM